MNVAFPFDAAARGDWTFHRLREVHAEQVDTLPYRAPINVTVWWGTEDRTVAVAPACQSGAPTCARFLLGMEAVFPVFIFERLGSVATLIAEIGGFLSERPFFDSFA